jgi:hypothetical protein
MQRTMGKAADGVVSPPSAKCQKLRHFASSHGTPIENVYVHKNCVVIGQHVISEENLFTFEYVSSYGILPLKKPKMAAWYFWNYKPALLGRIRPYTSEMNTSFGDEELSSQATYVFCS